MSEFAPQIILFLLQWRFLILRTLRTFLKITVVGIGYVGISNAILLSQRHELILHDIDAARVASINGSSSPIKDDLIERFFASHKDALRATQDASEAYQNSDAIIIAINTNYDENLSAFDTASIDGILSRVKSLNAGATVIIKSTLPIGYTQGAREKFHPLNILFCPEFLREGRALYDSLHPSRVVVGGPLDAAKGVADLFCECLESKEVPVFLMSPDEAEAVKLFSNTYLAMRVAFFNELHSYTLAKNLDAFKIIKAVSADARIGDHYNNPSFGYGGYCLPKDTKQLFANFKGIPSELMQAIIESNATRKAFIITHIKERGAKKIGIYRLVMKKDSDNFRNSAMLDLLEGLRDENLQLCIYEPLLEGDDFEGVAVERDFDAFARSCDLIVANRLDAALEDFRHKVFSADTFADKGG